MATGISTLGQSMTQISNLKRQQVTLNDLQLQLSSGKKTNKYSGLQTDVIISKRARAEFNSLETYINNITIADRRIEEMVNTIEEFQTQAGNVANIVAGELQEGEIDLARIHDLTENIMSFMEDLVNVQDNERYVFGGAASTEKPLSLAGGTLETFLRGELADWQAGTLVTDDLISSYRNVSDNVIGYNAPLSDNDVGSVTVRADKTVEVDYTTLGNASGFRDILVAVEMMNELTETDTSEFYHIEKIKLDADDFDENVILPTDLPQTPPPGGTALTLPADLQDPAIKEEFNDENQLRADNFFAVFNDLGRMINNAIDDLDTLRFNLESDRVRLAEIKDQHTLDKNTALGTIENVENVDINEVAVSLNFLQIQLEASYRVTSTVGSLTLANFL